MMAKLERGGETPAEAFLNTAQQYHLAATALLPLHQQVDSPLYFLFTHAIELAFKAYLRSHGLPTPQGPEGHALQDLFERCRGEGLQGHSELRNVIQLLESENKWHGFRYFLFKGTGRPEINYLREVVDELMVVVAEEVKMRPSEGLSGAVLKITVGKPEKK